jgi:nicotinate-nucleotide pyrophosphorylase (carboxylating)
LSKHHDLYRNDGDGGYGSLKNDIDKRSILANFLNEDIGIGDITSNALIDECIEANAKIVCKNDGDVIASGLSESGTIFDLCDCNPTMLVADGSAIKKGTTVMAIRGPAKSILKAERTALNLIMRMSGISTKTFQFVNKLGQFSKFVSVSSTRKTAPGLRYFDKKSVVLGGGISHRYRLDQLVLIKDNHIAVVGSVGRAVQLARCKYGPNIKIECEVSDFQGIIDAIESGSNIVMLDNFTPDLVSSSLEKIRNLGLRNKVVIEVSGGITLDNIYEYASSLPDVISIGSMTHSFQSIDYSLELSVI